MKKSASPIIIPTISQPAIKYNGVRKRTAAKGRPKGNWGKKKRKHTFLSLGDTPGKHMSQGFENNDPGEPAMNQVESIEWNLQKGNQGVVSPSQQDERNQVNGGHGASPVPDDPSDGIFLGSVGDGNNTQGHVHDNDTDEEEGVETAGESTHVDGPRQLEFPVVSIPEQRGVDNVVLDFCERPGGRHEIALMSIVEACQLSQMAGEAEPCFPGKNDDNHQAQGHEGVPCEVIVQDLIERILTMALFDLNRCGRESNQGQAEYKRAHDDRSRV